MNFFAVFIHSLTPAGNQPTAPSKTSSFYTINETQISNGLEDDKEEKHIYISSNQPVSITIKTIIIIIIIIE